MFRSTGSICESLNVGNIDRAVRILVDLVLVMLAGVGMVGIWGYIGVVLDYWNRGDLPRLHTARCANDVALAGLPEQTPRSALDAFLDRDTKLVGVTLLVLTVIRFLVVAALSWLLNHPEQS